MKIVERLGQKPTFSFEFFPPKDAEGVERLFETIAELRPYAPDYVSVTYGAAGSTQRLTVELVRRIKQEVGIEAMAHLTCVGATRDDLAGVLEELRAGGIENVIALRGDPPRGETTFKQTAGGFAHAAELVALTRARFDFCVAAACYPEKHTESPDAETDLRHLKAKVDAGVDFLITQLFFDNADYFHFVERAQKSGITVPIVAGIMPITNLSQVKRFTALCGSSIPAQLLSKLEACSADADAVRALGVEHATAQCRDLLARGAPGIHFYTLNRSLATRHILDRLRA
ncbi:MAG TPA: methylenetetrahydrofolate reductase [NAD(P)H] [Polyangiaceae bacterium]|nr:methylenetetrahydrofolate reductase [NAD(P)H] [Polyangiaceae bacterium]